MAQRGELFSSRVNRENRTYFFNIKENRRGDMFMSIVESKKLASGEFERHQIMVFEEDLIPFAEGMNEALDVMRKKRYERARREMTSGESHRDQNS
ncbi:MAG: DUF3276 family protein [Spirochaetales bacterium]